MVDIERIFRGNFFRALDLERGVAYTPGMSAYTAHHQKYALITLEGNAKVYAHLLKDLPEETELWDRRPDETRFTLREIVAHVLDFDTVCRERMEHMIREDNPFLPNWDEDEAARHYSGRNPRHELTNLFESRQTLTAWLEGLAPEEWERTGEHPHFGDFTVRRLLSLMLTHDGYHLRQITEWLTLPA